MAHVDPDYFKSKLDYFIEKDLHTEDSTEKESLADGIIAKMEKADWDCDEALVSVIPSIGDEVIRNDCRRILLSCKFKAALSYWTKSSSKQPYVDYVGDGCALIQYYENNGTSKTAAIISPSGEVKTPHGQIWINGNSMSYKGCFNARGVGEYKDKAGLVYHDGTILLPCIFNYIENGVLLQAQYNGVKFSIDLSDEPQEDDVLLRSYQVSDGFFIIVQCHGHLPDVVYDHPAIYIPRMNNGKQLTRQERQDLIDRMASEVFTILDGHFLL